MIQQILVIFLEQPKISMTNWHWYGIHSFKKDNYVTLNEGHFLRLGVPYSRYL